MSGKGSFYLLHPWQAVPDDNPKRWLGRIVRDYSDPRAAYTPRSGASLSDIQADDSTLVSASQAFGNSSSRSFQLDVLKAFGISLNNKYEQEHAFQTQQLQRLKIHQYDDALARVRDRVDVISDLQSWNLSFLQPLYFVVGVLVAPAISYTSTNSTSRGIAGDIDPLQIAGLAGGVPTPLSSSIGGGFTSGQSNQMESVAKENRIFAVEYRILKRKRIFDPSTSLRVTTSRPKGDRVFGSGDVDSTEEQETKTSATEMYISTETLTEFIEDQAEDAKDSDGDEDEDDLGKTSDVEHAKDRCFSLDN